MSSDLEVYTAISSVPEGEISHMQHFAAYPFIQDLFLLHLHLWQSCMYCAVIVNI